MYRPITDIHKDSSLQTNVIKVVAPLVLFMAGTGGMITSSSTVQADRWVSVPGIHIERNMGIRIPRSVTAQLRQVRRIFGLNISELTIMLGVTRPTIYSWLQGNVPKTEALVKIARLYNIANEIENLNIKRMDLLMHSPIMRGRSLFELLSNNEDIYEFLPDLKAISDQGDEARLQTKGSKNNRAIDPDDYSTPFYRD